MNRSQLQSVLSQRIKDIYKARLKQQLNAISYHLFDKTLVIIIEGSVTQVEQLLNTNERQQLAKQMRRAIDNIINPQIKIIIEEVMKVNIIDFMSDTAIDSKRTAAIAIFEFKTKFSLNNSRPS
jgi:uncharacterized protein YbcI